MANRTISAEDKKRIADALTVHNGNITAAAASLGMDRQTVRKHAGHVKAQIDSGNTIQAEREVEENANGTATIKAVTGKPIATYEEAVAAAGVDLTVWYVERWVSKVWSVGIKLKGGKGEPDHVAITQQHGVQLWLRRIVSRSIQAGLDLVYARMIQAAPKVPPAKPRKIVGEPFLAVLGLFDAHFGKLCWAPETGTDYDLKKAEAVFSSAVDDLIEESKTRPVARWLLPIGNDFFHMDNSRNTTYAGTPQDVDGRYPKVIEAGTFAMFNAVEKMRALAPVSVVWVPGNHDPTTSYHLAREIAARFHHASDVTVDYSPSPRKYFVWEKTLLGLTHGNEEKKDKLPNLMAQERPRAWADSVCREWLVGHDHRDRKWVTQSTDSFEGTTIRALRAITGTDSWHHRKGYVGQQPGAEVLFYGRDRGYAGHAVVPARMGE